MARKREKAPDSSYQVVGTARIGRYTVRPGDRVFMTFGEIRRRGLVHVRPTGEERRIPWSHRGMVTALVRGQIQPLPHAGPAYQPKLPAWQRKLFREVAALPRALQLVK
jgi:hypothetical protein